VGVLEARNHQLALQVHPPGFGTDHVFQTAAGAYGDYSAVCNGKAGPDRTGIDAGV